eukprot:GHVS01026348.1.p1 GENE.GHVS01026348.1~~GHVS01026348.1.p1  ORF type:complete len:111 (+),score=22.15 GHVS01026348.1:293-625(+)
MNITTDNDLAAVGDSSCCEGEVTAVVGVSALDCSDAFFKAVAQRFETLRNFKVTVFISSVGSASKLARQKFSIDGNSKFDALIAFLRKALKRDQQPLVVLLLSNMCDYHW